MQQDVSKFRIPPHRWGAHGGTSILVGLIAATLTIAAFAPGMMSPDSLSQLTEARSGEYQDWHPPVMAALWRQLDQLVAGPFLMLVLHNLFFWSGLTIIARLAFPAPWLAATVILAIGFWPTTFGLLGTIWKDTGLGCALVFASALLCHAGRTGSRGTLLLALPVLFYGSAVRHNAPAATLPFFLWWAVACWQGRPVRARRWLIPALGALLFLATVLGGRALSSALTRGASLHPIQQILVHDLVAVSLAEGKVLLPAYLEPAGQTWTLEELRELHDPLSVVPLFCCDSLKRRLPLTKDPAQIAQLRSFWLEILLSHPRAYAAHRWQLFVATLSPPPRSSSSVYLGVDPNSLGVVHEKTVLFRAARKYLDQFKESVLFSGWIYVLLAFLVLCWAVFRGVRGPAVYAITTSGLLYAGTLLLSGTVTDFRMLWWSSIAALLSLPLLRISRTGETSTR